MEEISSSNFIIRYLLTTVQFFLYIILIQSITNKYKFVINVKLVYIILHLYPSHLCFPCFLVLRIMYTVWYQAEYFVNLY